jgi:ketosteroid isomerase-like protein
MSMNVNHPAVVAELTAQFEAYERALVANDVEALNDFFWESPLATRFGVSEELHGAEEIARFRAQRKVSFGDRRILRQSILTLGEDFGVSMLEFTAPGGRHGRQTQVWARLPDLGWRIVSAHVSHRLPAG